MLWLLLIGVLVGVSVAAYQQIYGYWKKRGVEGPAPVPLFGNLFEYITGKKHFGEVYGEIYR